MSILVGEVIGVHGSKITLKSFENSNKETLFFDGEKYKGVSIREYLAIRRGFRDVICIVEGEFLDERQFETDGAQVNYIRKVEAKPIGYLEDNEFHHGIKFLPMIKDSAYLLSEDTVAKIFGREVESDFVIGKMLKEDIPISLPWSTLFSSHIGIFGNTGSGKSNTLAKLFTLLFERKSAAMAGKSNFVILDFNGEYTNNQLTSAEHKSVLRLNTQTEEDKFPLSPIQFWDSETLSILFQATTHTQKPFLNRIITRRAKYATRSSSLTTHFRATLARVFQSMPARGETLNLARRLSSILGATDLESILSKIVLGVRGTKFTYEHNLDTKYFETDGKTYDEFLAKTVEGVNLDGLDAFDELIVRAHLMLINDLIYGAVQFEHIQPLMKRMDSSISGLKKIMSLSDVKSAGPLLTVISLRRCKPEMKKVLPLLIAKHYYDLQKDRVGNPPDKTMHLIIDEAHNILSQQSSREHEVWKDYRLEMFEEVIKEGRKFGMYLTLASQRPADISPTIVSQLHNFFIHRLVNDRDLFLLENTISTLDSLSKSLIPNLAQGSCVVTGTSFELPMILQIDKLSDAMQPDSIDVPLDKLWASEE